MVDVPEMSGLLRIKAAEMKEIQLGILEHVDAYCRRSGIRYYLWAGTLIGAVRHKGFIPWDDDIDLAMPRTHYERFCKGFNDAAESNGLSLFTHDQASHRLLQIAKVADNRTILIERTDDASRLGVNIDIFPIDGWPNGRHAQWRHSLMLNVYRSARMLQSVSRRGPRIWSKSIMLLVGKSVLRPVSAEWLVRRISKRASCHRFDQSQFVGVQVGGPAELVARSVYGEPQEVEFEGRLYPVPREWGVLLSAKYGNYSRVPPKAEQISHHEFDAYWARS